MLVLHHPHANDSLIYVSRTDLSFLLHFCTFHCHLEIIALKESQILSVYNTLVRNIVIIKPFNPQADNIFYEILHVF